MNHADMDDACARHLKQRLHDGLGQSLSLAVIQIDQATATETEALRRTRALLREALQELRSLIGAIGRVAETAEPDLPGGLAACVHRLNAQQAVPVSCTIEGPPLSVSAQDCRVLLDATRELLVNACKHGQAIGVDARLSVLPHRLSITVTERRHAAGIGAPASTAPTARGIGLGLGLRASRQGLSLIGARLRWRDIGPGGVQARISWVPR